MNYLAARERFLWGCGDPTGEDRERAIAAFDTTLIAHQAKLADTWAEFWEQVWKSLGLR